MIELEDRLRARPVDRRWEEYPLGTIALALEGGHWTKVERGWKWFCGDTFPRPGGSAFDVILPKEPTHER